MHNIETYVDENIELSGRKTANGTNGMLFEFILPTDLIYKCFCQITANSKL